jgi:hypothetical protein
MAVLTSEWLFLFSKVKGIFPKGWGSSPISNNQARSYNKGMVMVCKEEE